MNNPYPLCRNCVHEDVPTQESPCAECQAAFFTDHTKPLFKSKEPKTNADRLCNDMEYLAMFLADLSGGDCPPESRECELVCRPSGEPWRCWLAWLKQEVE